MVSCHQTIDLNSSHNQMKNISSRSINPYDESDSLLELARNHLSKRSVPEFEATLNAMKCALRIVGLQVSGKYRNFCTKKILFHSEVIPSYSIVVFFNVSEGKK